MSSQRGGSPPEPRPAGWGCPPSAPPGRPRPRLLTGRQRPCVPGSLPHSPADPGLQAGVSASELAAGLWPRIRVKPDPAPVSLPAEVPTRTGRRRPPQGRGRHTTASTVSTCPVCTAAAAATGARPASRPRPTPSATPRSRSTCESGERGAEALARLPGPLRLGAAAALGRLSETRGQGWRGPRGTWGA